MVNIHSFPKGRLKRSRRKYVFIHCQAIISVNHRRAKVWEPYPNSSHGGGGTLTEVHWAQRALLQPLRQLPIKTSQEIISHLVYPPGQGQEKLSLCVIPRGCWEPTCLVTFYPVPHSTAPRAISLQFPLSTLSPSQTMSQTWRGSQSPLHSPEHCGRCRGYSVWLSLRSSCRDLGEASS